MAQTIPERDLHPSNPSGGFERALFRFVERPNIGLILAAIAVGLALPCLFLGFYLDDWVLQYIYSRDLAGAKHLFDLYVGGYGIANGNPVDNHWQAEAGHAPWWIYPQLLISTWRPVSELTHLFDARFYLNTAWPMHLHSLLWLGAFILIATRFYRGVLGPKTGGLAALLLALDHTRGFEVGFITNRHALVSGVLGVLTLEMHRDGRATGSIAKKIAAPLVYFASLFASESSLAVAAYLFAYSLFVDDRSPSKRALAFAPYLLVTAGWRAWYNAAGYGAKFSGIYIDPAREPLHFARALLERGPILVLGQFLGPPPESYAVFSAPIAHAVLAFAFVFVIAFALVLRPVLAESRTARFWALGFVGSLVPAAATHPHSRQLLLASIGGMGLVAELWRHHAIDHRGVALTPRVKASRSLAGLVLFFHLVVSPGAAPFFVCSIAATAPLHHVLDRIGPEVGGKDVVFLTSPDFWIPRLVQLKHRVGRMPLARRWRALAFGSERVTVRRTGDRTLRLDYEGGILSTPFTELYRDRRLAMASGDHVNLKGLDIEVIATTADGRVTTADFDFDAPLDSASFLFYYWTDHGYVPTKPPAIGKSVVLPVAQLSFYMK